MNHNYNTIPFCSVVTLITYKMNNKMKTKIISIFLIALTTIVFAQEKQVTEGNINNLPVREHTITLREATVNKAGKDVMGMTVNGR